MTKARTVPGRDDGAVCKQRDSRSDERLTRFPYRPTQAYLDSLGISEIDGLRLTQLSNRRMRTRMSGDVAGRNG